MFERPIQIFDSYDKEYFIWCEALHLLYQSFGTLIDFSRGNFTSQRVEYSAIICSFRPYSNELLAFGHDTLRVAADHDP